MWGLGRSRELRDYLKLNVMMRLVAVSIGLSSIVVTSGCSGNNSTPLLGIGKQAAAVPTPTMVVSVKMQKSKSEEQIEFTKVNVTELWEPLCKLAVALTQDHKANRFRLAWWLGFGSSNTSATVLYNRKDRTLIYYCHGWDATDKPPKIKDHYLYVGVTDNILDRLAKSMYLDPRGSSTSAAGFDQLPKYGCKRYKLR